MLKGCQKKIIYVSDTGSRFFDEAYFVMKSGDSFAPSADIIKEAVRIAEKSLKNQKNTAKMRRKKMIKYVFFGASFTSFIFGFVMLFFTLAS